MSDPQSEYDHVANLMALQPGVSRAKMFGMPSVMVNGKAFAGLSGESMIFKLSGEAHRTARAIDGAKLFEPMAGRPMKEWVSVPPEQSERWLELAGAALEYVRSLAGIA
jgi:hypothetical protein